MKRGNRSAEICLWRDQGDQVDTFRCMQFCQFESTGSEGSWNAVGLLLFTQE